MLVKVILYNHFKVIELRAVTVCFLFDVENQNVCQMYWYVFFYLYKLSL